MANIRISGLPSEASPSASDVVPIDGATTRKATLTAAVTAGLADSVVTTAKINAGAVTTAKIADSNVTNAKLANMTALSVKANPTNSSAVAQDVAAANDGEVLRRSGTAVGFGSVSAAGLATDAVETAKIKDANVTTAKLADEAVTKGKLENSAALSVIGRAANSSGVTADIAAGSDGAILRRSGTSIGFGDASSANVNYDQGGTNSVATTVQTRLRLMEVCPEDFGCVGDGSTDDSTNFTRFISALKVVSAARGAVLGRLRGVYAISSQQTLSSWSGQITLIADAGAGIKTTGSGSYTGLYVAGGGATGSTFTISGSPSYGAETIPLSAVTGLSVGDYCEIENATGYSSDVRFMRNRIRAIAGSDVTLDLPLAFDINSSNTTRFQKVALQSGFKSEGINAVHTGSGQVNGLSFYNLLEPQIINTRTADYNSTNSQGFVTYGIYGGLIDGVYDTNSGQSSNSDAIVLGCTNADILNIRSIRAAGFGIGATFCSANRMVNLTSLRAVGRGFKMFGSCDNSIENVRVDGSGSSFTGFAFSGGSSFNRVQNVVARRNGTGIWLNGTGNINNLFDGVEASSNTTDITVATTSPLDDTGNVFDNVRGATTYSLSSTAAPVIRRARRLTRVVTAAGDVTVTADDDVVIVNKSSGAATAVNLPASPFVGQRVTIKDGKGDSKANVISVTPAAGNIDGASNYLINTYYGAATFTYNGTQWNVTDEQKVPPIVLAAAVSVDMNSTADQAITLRLPAGYTVYRFQSILILDVTAAANSAVGGLYTAASKSGTQVWASSTAFTGLTAAGASQQPSVSTAGILETTDTTLFFSLTTAHGSASTGTLYVHVYPVR